MPSFGVLQDASCELCEEPPKATSSSNPRDHRDNRLVHVIEPVKGIKGKQLTSSPLTTIQSDRLSPAITRDHTRSSGQAMQPQEIPLPVREGPENTTVGHKVIITLKT
jgi:hypothetical protein